VCTSSESAGIKNRPLVCNKKKPYHNEELIDVNLRLFSAVNSLYFLSNFYPSYRIGMKENTLRAVSARSRSRFSQRETASRA